MMSNLFSIFDPVASFNLPLNWLSLFLGFLILPYNYWLLPNRYSMFFHKISSILHGEFKTLLGVGYNKGHTLLFISLFYFIVLNNLFGLVPYVFTATSHLSITLSLALPLWFSFILAGWINHTKHMLAHLVPEGTPGLLMPFMVLIETISNVIRPGTLAVRLAANMIAGHLLLALLCGQGPNVSFPILSILIVVQMALLLLEFAVAAIQSYVFAVLTTLYASEVN